MQELDFFALYLGLFACIGVCVYHVVESLKLPFNAYVYRKADTTQKDPAWYQLLWRVISLGIGVLLGWAATSTEYYEYPFGQVCGAMAAIFASAIYSKVKAAVDDMKLLAKQNSDH
jgi:hypothetical protein